MTPRVLLFAVAALILVAAIVLFASRGGEKPGRPIARALPSPAQATRAADAERAANPPAPINKPELAGFAAEVYASLRDTPGAMNPEIALLDRNDWASVDQYGKDARFAPGERVARAANAAKHEARAKAIRALLRAAQESARNGTPPASLEDLAASLRPEIGPGILARYELLPKSAWPPEIAKDVEAAVRAYQMAGRPALAVDAIVIEKNPGGHAPAFGFIYGENFFTSGYVDSPEP